MCRVPVACFGTVYVHVAAVVIAACIVLFGNGGACTYIGKTSARASDDKGRRANGGGKLFWGPVAEK